MSHESTRERAGYEPFFGFHRPPFSLTPDTRFRFESESHAAALAEVSYALERREPIVVVSGDIGTGKTLLCRTVIEQSDRKTFVAIIDDPQLERDELLMRMLEDFGVVSKDRAARAQTPRHELVHALQEFLGSLAPIRAHAVLIIDEAHHVQADVLEQIRLLSNIQDERGTLLQIILVGQDGLNAVLARPELRQLKQRVSRFVRLDALSAPEIAGYIRHRLAVAREQRQASTFPGARELERELAAWDGSQPDAPFTPEAIAAVAQISGGTPRVVNLLCDRALEAAYRHQSRTVDAATINQAADALGLAPAPPPAPELSVWPQVAPAATGATAAPTPPAAPRARRYGAIATLIGVAVFAVFAVRGALRQPAGETTSRPAPAPSPQPARPPRNTTAPAAAPRETPPPAVTQPAPTPPPAAAPTTQPATNPTAPPAALPRATGTTATSPSAGPAFEIVVASFRTEVRATDVAAAIAALGEPVERRALGGWQQVVAGPYGSDDLARAAQARLQRAGFTGTHVAPAAR